MKGQSLAHRFIRGRASLLPAALLLLLGLLVGVAIGPQVRIWCWTTVLDRCPSDRCKMRAAAALGESGTGREALKRRVLSPDSLVRELSVLELVGQAGLRGSTNTSDLLQVIPDSYTTERLRLLGSLDYAAEHEYALGTLCYELKHEKSPQVRAEARRILRSFADISVDRLCQKMGVSLSDVERE